MAGVIGDTSVPDTPSRCDRVACLHFVACSPSSLVAMLQAWMFQRWAQEGRRQADYTSGFPDQSCYSWPGPLQIRPLRLLLLLLLLLQDDALSARRYSSFHSIT
ncbi:hypothetical protein NQZ68_017289 [Dissostichus eleginoides]|nr:hypothetical protein NQZ68_017289 [Dissostichus eleginoides]